MMASSLEICELFEQLWPHQIFTCLVHSRKSYVIRNLMAMTASKKMLNWLRHQDKDVFAASINKLIKRWDKYINVAEDYVEKLKKCQVD